MHIPDSHIPGKNSKNEQNEPLGSFALQSSLISSHDSLQLSSPSGPEHGSSKPIHVPSLAQKSLLVQNNPSSQGSPEFIIFTQSFPMS